MRLSAKDTLEGVSGETSPDQRWKLSSDPMTTIPQEGHAVELQRRGDLVRDEAMVGVGRISTHAIMLRGPQRH